MKHFRHILRTTLAFVLAASLLLFGVPSAFATPAAPSDPTQNSGTGTAGGGNGTGNGGGSGNGAGSGTGNGDGSGAGDFGDPSTYVPDQIIVIFEENAQLEADIEALKDDMDALAEEIQENSPELSPATTEAEDNETQVEIVTENDKDSLFAVVDLPDEVDVLTALELALENPSVIGVSPDYYIHPLDDEPLDLSQSIETLASVNDPFYSSQQYGLPLIRAPEAWDYAQCNGAVTVAVVDGGARLTHEDLAANLDLAHAWDGSGDSAAANKPLLQAVANGEIPYEGDTGVSSGHGTHVSGIVSAVSNNNKGIAGVSYNATVLPVNIYYNPGSGYTTTVQRLVRAYDYLIDLKSSGQTPNLRVINLSLGTPGWSEQSITSVRNKIIAAENLGMLTVAAAGNSASSVNIYPADIDKAVAVTSVDSNKQLLSTSSYGDEKDICAPGANIYSTWYDSNTGYGYNTGTSMAAPMVAGVAALIWAANPNLTVDQVKNILFSTAEDLGAPGKDPYYGHGLVDAAAALKKACLPTITGDDDITLAVGYGATSRTYAVGGTPAPILSLNNNTANASINTGGVLTIPAGLAVGTYSTTINATNTNGTTTKTVTVKVNPIPPAIEGGLSSITLTEGYANYSSAYTITGVPTPALSLTNNTAGATLAANGFIIPAGLTPGSYTVTLSASNVGGTATKTVVIVINPKPFAPTITGGSEVITLSAGYAATTSAYTATGYPVPTFSLTNNTAKATINANGALTIPAGLAVGTYEVTINAANTVGSATKTVAVKVNAVPAKPTITGAGTITRTEGYTEIMERYTFTGYPAPEVNIINNTSEAGIWGNIVAIPEGLSAGTYTFTITAKNTQGTVSKKVTVKINPKPVAPTIKNAGKTITLKKNYKKTTKTYTVKGTPKPKVTLSVPKGAKGKIKINQNGKLTIAKGLKKGTYKITIIAKNTVGTTKLKVTIKVK